MEKKEQEQSKIGTNPIVIINGLSQHTKETKAYLRQLTDKMDSFGCPRFSKKACGSRIGLFISPDGENYYDLVYFLVMFSDKFEQIQKVLAGVLVKSINLGNTPNQVKEDEPFFTEAGIDKKEDKGGKET